MPLKQMKRYSILFIITEIESMAKYPFSCFRLSNIKILIAYSVDTGARKHVNE